MNLRLATENDIPAILEIFNDALVNTTAVYSYQKATLEEQLDWFRHKTEAGIPVYVAEDESGCLGYITYGPFRTRPAYKYTVELSIYVDSKARNKGIGKAMMAKILQVCEEKELKILICGIDSENKASIALCQKFGFTHSGSLKKVGYKFGHWLDLEFYQLELKGPSHPEEI
jgi:L-amino acid N-acyltransferase YncA